MHILAHKHTHTRLNMLVVAFAYIYTHISHFIHLGRSIDTSSRKYLFLSLVYDKLQMQMRIVNDYVIVLFGHYLKWLWPLLKH